jgi:hypothetical protein
MTALERAIREAMASNSADRLDQALDQLWVVEGHSGHIDLLHELLLSDRHHQHQLVTRCIQNARDPRSVEVIQRVLQRGFEPFAYTCSDDAVIAKWFSHALADIGTRKAIQVIHEYAGSPNQEVAQEMRYRIFRMTEYPHR